MTEKKIQPRSEAEGSGDLAREPTISDALETLDDLAARTENDDIKRFRRGQRGRIKNVYTKGYLSFRENFNQREVGDINVVEADDDPTIEEVIDYLEGNKEIEGNKERFYHITTERTVEGDIDFLKSKLYKSQLGVEDE